MKYFGTDGIRNTGEFFLTNNFAYIVGRSLSLLYNKNIYIGYDTRCSSPAITHLLISGALSVGLNVYNLNTVSTPCVAYYSLLYNAIGISITASHNPYTDNGIKIFLNGEKLNDSQLQLIEKYLDNPTKENIYGTIQNKCPLEYISFLNQFKTDTSHVLLDTSNGASSNLASYFFNNIICKNPNGININDLCGSTHIENIISHTKDKYQYGIAFDGDGDRLLIVDKKGYIYTGDMLIFILCKYYNLKSVVLTKMVNPGIYNLFIKNNIKIYLSDVGDSNVYQLMKEHNVLLGGEDSGHIINLNYLPFGDGLFNALIILKIINELDIGLINYINPNVKYPEYLINYKNLTEAQINKINYFIDKYQNNLDYKILLRKSGTEELYRLYISCKEQETITKLLEDINNV